MTKLLPLALLFCTGLASAETWTFTISGYHAPDQIYFEGGGMVSLADGVTNATVTDLTGFSMVLYDIQDSTNPAWAYDTYHMAPSDLLPGFSATVDGNGTLEQLIFQTANMDALNVQSSLAVNWSPNAPQPTGFVGGIGVDVTVTEQAAAMPGVPEPESYGMLIVSGILLVGLGIRRWRDRRGNG